MNYQALFDSLNEFKTLIFGGPKHSCKRVVGGKMNDDSVWYLPFLYIDGYIDIHGCESIDKAIDNVLKGVVDGELCDRLSWYISCCSNHKHVEPNKCFYDFPGYVESSSKCVYICPDVQDFKTYFYFGFSEKAAQIERDSTRTS